MAIKLIDARHLAPPEPLELTLAALDGLGHDDEIVLLLYRQPTPLYAILQENGFSHRVVSQPDGSFEIHITYAVR